jgi:hypothetical protein
LAYQPPASSVFFSKQTSHQPPASTTFLSEQISTSHQPPAKRTGCKFVFIVWMIMPVSLINHNCGALFHFLECLSQNILALLYEKDGNYHCCALSYDIAISTPKKNERETKT